MTFDILVSSSSPKFPSRNPQLKLTKFLGKTLIVPNKNKISSFTRLSHEPTQKISALASSYRVRRSVKLWDNHLKPNIVEIQSANELVDTLKNAGDKLVVVGFYSHACGGCTALHPKIVQQAESNPDAIFLQVNYDEQRNMCDALDIPVLPFFKFYKGSKGLVCRFSCSVSTIKKFKDALAKHGAMLKPTSHDGPAKGLDEAELTNLASTIVIR